MPSFSTILTGVLAAAASAFAYTTPTTFNQTLDPIYTPTLGELVPVGKPFSVTWKPTESGTISLVLLRGPSTNVKPLYAIAEKIKNTGSFSWTPKADLEPDSTHYGIQLIVDASGQFQYSVQFGISNPSFKPIGTTSGSSSMSATGTSSASTTEATTTSVSTITHTSHSSVTSMVTVTTSAYTSSALTTYSAPSNTTTTHSTSSYVMPTVTASTSPVPSQTGAAANLKVAGSLLVGVAGVAALLL